MNERIKELMMNSWNTYFNEEMNGTRFPIVQKFDAEKFAQLIVRECVGLCDQAAEENARTFYTVTETREIGPALVAKGSQVQAEKLSQQIKQYFGIDG